MDIQKIQQRNSFMSDKLFPIIPSISPKSIEDSYIAMPTKEEQYRYISMTKQADKSVFELRKSIDAIDAVIKSLINS
jgi:type I restriction enzyme S subunit